MSRRRATVDHIIHQKTDRELLDAIQLVYKMHDDNEVFSKYHDQKETPEYKAILLVLNNHEFIALGIRRRAFAETIYKELQCSNFLKVWNSSAGIVEELRKSSGRETLFQEFEWLAKRWKENPLKKH
ncbi:hypothetical protein AGMMS49545_01020 [Betaproteobacteria bacterium]|nr:hypothetical protein AGMMS49545_01020 [Betaproteobacteria bacterium]